MCISTASKHCCGFLRFYRWVYRVPCIRIYRIRWSRGIRTEVKESVPRRPERGTDGKGAPPGKQRLELPKMAAALNAPISSVLPASI
ncbi:hypothetical protein PsYK624_097950 [Phanerochaete sordida]|uniref:Uncharacterized protein n=1 Tax=Phanerochaete sordida TaxID=48140 RepID=A0A9P3GF16_9APHY|nr:hypothetical protein PsYK624_097950 [Phanerochaete sordida]